MKIAFFGFWTLIAIHWGQTHIGQLAKPPVIHCSGETADFCAQVAKDNPNYQMVWHDSAIDN